MPSRHPSLRRRLQTSSLVAVLAGYAVLLVVNREFSTRARNARHQQTVDLLERELSMLPANASPAALQARLESTLIPGWLLWLELEPGRPYHPPTANTTVPLPVPLPQLLSAADPASSSDRLQTIHLGGRTYLSCSQPLTFLSRPARLRALEDITPALERQRTIQLLLVAAAGLSALITSVLLRLVLRRGLRPLEQLSHQLAAIDAERLEQEQLSQADQPSELQPIVVAFNGLLDRLAASRQREQAFVDGVAHELRTPITLISGQAQSLQRQADASGLQPLRLIASEAQRMGRLVTDLLDLARDDTGRLELRTAAFDLDDALLVAYERLEPLAPGRLRLQLPADGAPPLVRGDPERLQQCLTNLVENALKYTPPGSPIELFSSTTAAQVIAHVRDHGPGVPAAERARIFDRFVRSSAAASGSGLGLSIVRLLMQRMGGAVRVVEAPNGGAEFQLLLERVDSAAALNPSPPPP